MTRRTIIVCTALLLTAGMSSAEQHPFTVHDLVAMERVSDPQPSPDGDRVAFVITTMDLEANKGRKDVWLVGTDGSGAQALTTDPANDWSPRWRSDGTLYFLSSRSGSAQVWRWNFRQRRRRSPGDRSGARCRFAQDRSQRRGPLSRHGRVPGLRRLRSRAPRRGSRNGLRAKTSGMIFDKIFIRHWDTWKDGTRNHVFRSSHRRRRRRRCRGRSDAGRGRRLPDHPVGR